MIYKSYPIIVETSLNFFSHSKMMTAVTSHLFLPELISEMPPGSAKDIPDRLTGQHLCVYTFCTFPFISCFGLV